MCIPLWVGVIVIGAKSVGGLADACVRSDRLQIGLVEWWLAQRA